MILLMDEHTDFMVYRDNDEYDITNKIQKKVI